MYGQIILSKIYLVNYFYLVNLSHLTQMLIVLNNNSKIFFTIFKNGSEWFNSLAVQRVCGVRLGDLSYIWSWTLSGAWDEMSKNLCSWVLSPNLDMRDAWVKSREWNALDQVEWKLVMFLWLAVKAKGTRPRSTDIRVPSPRSMILDLLVGNVRSLTGLPLGDSKGSITSERPDSKTCRGTSLAKMFELIFCC